jgi:hypothetical protein
VHPSGQQTLSMQKSRVNAASVTAAMNRNTCSV